MIATIMKQNLRASALALAMSTMFVTHSWAQGISSKVPPLSLTPTSAGAAAATAHASSNDEADRPKKLNTPVAALISVPIQNNWDFGIGSAHAMKYTANIQPVVPISISENWTLIIRTILPVIYAESPVKGGA